MQEIKYNRCFGCGSENPVGLKLDFASENTGSSAWFDSPSRYEGYDGVIHGGIIATLLDEAMAKEILARGLIAVTADLGIRYRNPLKVGTRVKVSGKITQQKSRTIHASSVIEDEQGKIYAEATAVYIVVKRLI